MIDQTLIYDNIISIDIINKYISNTKTTYSRTVKINLPQFHDIIIDKDKDIIIEEIDEKVSELREYN